jgi:hypothetical protein
MDVKQDEALDRRRGVRQAMCQRCKSASIQPSLSTAVNIFLGPQGRKFTVHRTQLDLELVGLRCGSSTSTAGARTSPKFTVCISRRS